MSLDGTQKLLLQPDGNLVLYGPGQSVQWGSNTFAQPVTTATLEASGNFVLKDAADNVIYQTSSSTGDGSAAQARLLDNGQWQIERSSDGAAIWESVIGSAFGLGINCRHLRLPTIMTSSR